MKRRLAQFIRFGWIQAISCMFAVVIFGAMAVTKYMPIPFIPRYDAILLICIVMQGLLLWTKQETLDECKVIIVFHLIGLALELYKVQMGSWSYPDEGWTKIGGVPLYSGFMYSSIASYICQAWRRFDIAVSGWPPVWMGISLSVAIYANFFTHHYLFDVRYFLMLALLPVFGRSTFTYKINGQTYRMHVILSFLLIAFFIWIAENISTFMGAWAYPDQESVWRLVHLGKLGSWFLLVIISIIIITELKRFKGKEQICVT
ncbi:DUF817 domain-containing protein [Paenibacillus curdlanolyticus]|nr:DUF817 domain-containing protein [Paenibacillus curdlanolyticus]